MKMQQRKSDRSEIFQEREEFYAPSSSLIPARVGPSTARSLLLGALATLPFFGFLVGAILFNQVSPFVFGFPRLLAWVVLWIVLTSFIMWTIYYLDPQNTPIPAHEESRQ
jgi:hypothetical protein